MFPFRVIFFGIVPVFKSFSTCTALHSVFEGVMKKAVKWTLTRLKKAVVNVDQVKKGSGRCQPGRKEQDGQHQPRKQKWSTSMTFFMTYCLVKNVAPKKSLYSNVFGYIFLQLVIKSAADIDHCTFLGQH